MNYDRIDPAAETSEDIFRMDSSSKRVLATAASLAIALLMCACAPTYSSGERVGVVTKLSYKGIVWKSWEGSLNQGGTRAERDPHGGESVVPNVLDFNVQDPRLVKQLQDAMDSGKRVKISYKQWLINPPSIDNEHVVQSVVVLD